MSFKLLSLSSVYPGSLKKFYNENPNLSIAGYKDHYGLLIRKSTDFVASYTRAFCKQGVDAHAIILNERKLQRKWASEYGLKTHDSKEILRTQISYFQPDVLWVEDLLYFDSKFLSEIRKSVKTIRCIAAYHCAPANYQTIKKLKLFDFVITCTPGLKVDLENIGIKSYHVYHGFDTDLLQYMNNENVNNRREVVFSGSIFSGEGYHNSRLALLNYLINSGLNISLFINIEGRFKILLKKLLYAFNKFLQILGMKKPWEVIHFLEYGKHPVRSYPKSILDNIQEPVYGIEMYNLLSDSEIVLNNHGDVAGNFAGNMRLFEATGVGVCLLTDYKINIEELFEINKEVVVYRSPEDCAEKIKWLRANDDVRRRIAAAGQKKTLKMHTVTDRVGRIKRILEGELENSGFNIRDIDLHTS